ncbi:MAG: AsmA-like C-terminal region-containing protein [Bacteroidales bacterium]
MPGPFLHHPVTSLSIASVLWSSYGEELQEFTLNEINRRIDTRIDVGERIRPFQSFPYSSVVLEDVTLWSSHNFQAREFGMAGADTLLHARSLTLQVSPWGLLRKRFKFRKMDITNGKIHLLTDQSGEVNYRISDRPEKEGRSRQNVEIGQFRLSGFDVLVWNRNKQLLASGRIDRLDFHGKLSKRQSLLRAELDGMLREITNKGIPYASQRQVQAKLAMQVRDSDYQIKNAQVQIDRFLADVEGSLRANETHGFQAQLEASARNLEIHEVLDLLPAVLSNPMADLKGNGILELDARIEGPVSATESPRIEASFQTQKASLQWDKLPFPVKKMRLEGVYSNGGGFSPVSTTLTISTLEAQFGEDRISASGHIRNFFEPDFQIRFRGASDMNQWIEWLQKGPFAKGQGALISDLDVQGRFTRSENGPSHLTALDVNGQLGLEDIDLTLRNSGARIENLRGQLRIENDAWKPEVRGQLEGSEFELKGSGLNLISYLLGKEDLLLASMSLHAKRLDLKQCLAAVAPSEKKPRGGPSKAVRFPKNIGLNLDFVADEFLYDRFQADHLRGRMTYEHPSLRLVSLRMQSMEGSMEGGLMLEQRTDLSMGGDLEARLDGIDIRQLFYAFHNFGQDELTHEHLNGRISGNSRLHMELDSTFRILTPSLISENKIIIRDGELNQFSPLHALSRFIEVEELNAIRFHTLENTILIRDNQIIIPAMDVRSNALDLSASGIHRFDKTYDYRIQLKLSDLLYKKAKTSEFEVAEDAADKRVLFLQIVEEGTGARVEIDRERTREKIRSDMKEEKQNLKSILNEELGLYKRDSTIRNKEEDREPAPFRMEFGDEEETPVQEPADDGRPGWLRRRLQPDTTQRTEDRPFRLED